MNLDLPGDGDVAQASAPSRAASWPPFCTLSELSRILTLVHGVRAPTESSLKKWSAAGVFRPCIATEDEVLRAAAALSSTHAVLQRPRRAGRPGLTLRTAQAIARVHELWPFLGDSDPHAWVELVVARTSDHLRSALGPTSDTGRTAPPAPTGPSPSSLPVADPTLLKIERQLAAVMQEMAVLKRELAQFSALRNNLITRLDEAVTQAKDALAAGHGGNGGIDPLVEARRDRDMGVMKSTLSEILDVLRRLETERAPQGTVGMR